MRVQYLIRLDDANPGMSRERWQKMEDLLDKYSVKPLVGIIPHNESGTMTPDSIDMDFWSKARRWHTKGWCIAMHGYSHVYTSKSGGINPFWKRSEFAGMSYDDQKSKIREGLSIMNKNGLKPSFFYAPSHTFDETTLEVLETESQIRLISDTVALAPYKRGPFIFIPQFLGQCRKIIIPGVYTFCFHPNRMKDSDYLKLDIFIKTNLDDFMGYNDLLLDDVRGIRLIDKIAAWLFFAYRKVRRLS